MLSADDFEKRMSLKFLQTLNRHLPKKRKTLRELLSESRPCIKAIDGSIHCFDKNELGKLADMIQEHDELRLPIYLEMSASMGGGAIRVSGMLECGIINKILHKEITKRDSMTVYYPHLVKIRKELPTTTQFMFTI